MERDSGSRLENPPQVPLTVRQLDILRLLGKGNSLSEIPGQLGYRDNDFVFGEMEEMGRAFGVSGRTPAVMHALDNGSLQTEEMTEIDFDWNRIDQLRPQFKAILEAFTHAKDEDLTDEEFKNLKAETSQSPKAYITKSIDKMLDETGLNNKTELVVCYYARRKMIGENRGTIVSNEEKILTERVAEALVLLSKGVKPSAVIKRMGVKGSTLKTYKKQILEALQVGSIREAVAKARELGILKN